VTEMTERLCPSCGNANPADAQFCRECGAILVQSRGGAARSTTARELESGKPTPGEMPRAPLSRRGRGLAAIVVAGLLLVALLVAYQRKRAGTLPVPGKQQAEATPSPAEQRAEAAAAKPTAAAPSPAATPAREEARTKPTASAPSEVASARPPAPPASHEPANEEAPARSSRGAAPKPTAETPRRHRPGWYVVRYRTPLFQSPNETASIIIYLAPGTRILVTRAIEGFLAVESTTGKRPGYVSADDVLPESVAGTYP
jgi:hypothetical protein